MPVLDLGHRRDPGDDQLRQRQRGGGRGEVQVGDVSGSITGIRFYKGSTNTGTHVGTLWTAAGAKLASATFSDETASGWQQVSFASPVAINANATYVASYFAPVGHTSQDEAYMYPPSPGPDGDGTVDSPPLHALRNANGTVNGLFRNSGTSTFPTNSYNATNYWVDVMFTPNSGPASAPAAPSNVTVTAANASASVSWTAPSDGGSSITSYTITPYVGTSARTPTTVTGSPPATTATVTGLTNGTSYTFTVSASNSVGTGPASAASKAVTPSSTSCFACTIWPSTATPANPSIPDSSSVELGVKFKSDVSGSITGIRFYKGSTNTGTHVGTLWTAAGAKLASATFSDETASGWQQVSFASPVAITAGTVYVASYFAPVGNYAANDGGFTSAGVDSPPLHALKDGVSGGNGVYAYGSTSTFPTNSYNATNYWVDVVFAGSLSAPAAPSNVTVTAGNASASVSWTAPSDGGSSITSYTITPYVGTSARTPTTVTGSPPATTATVTGLTNGTSYTFTVSASNSVGTGPASAASKAVTPAAASAPAAPSNVTVTAGNASASVSWTAPSDGGSSITSYTITPYVGTSARTPTTVTGSPPATTATVTGLTNGTSYTFTVSASNSVGTGPASAASKAVTPSSTSCFACTIWPSTATPANPSIPESSLVQPVKSVGRVRVDHGDPAPTGRMNNGPTWQRRGCGGAKLASVMFSDDGASGGQELSSPARWRSPRGPSTWRRTSRRRATMPPMRELHFSRGGESHRCTRQGWGQRPAWCAR